MRRIVKTKPISRIFRKRPLLQLRPFCGESRYIEDAIETKREHSFPYHSRIDYRTPISSDSNKNVERIVERYGNKKPTPGTLQQLIALSNIKHRLAWGPHVQHEMLVRLTSRLKDFENFPQGLLAQKQVISVMNMYRAYVEQIESLECTDSPSLNREFMRLLTEFKAKDSSTLPLIAFGIRDWRESGNDEVVDNTLAAQLDDFFTARLSIRMLIGQYCEYANPDTPGQIERGLVINDVAQEAKEKVTKMTTDKYGRCPDIVIKGNLDCRLTYIRSFLHHILVELVKNSARATCESKEHLDTMPPIEIVIAGGKEDCVIKVSDEGGGIPRSAIKNIWSYQFSTSQERPSSVEEWTFRKSFSGSGYGLPIARVFARYFGGDLDVVCTEGWGTDAYIHLKRVENAAVEVLPD